MKKNTKKGFTLVELVIVIAVIAILSAILIPTFGDIISNANETAYQKAANSAFTEAMEKAADKVSFKYAVVIYFDGGIGSEAGENGVIDISSKTPTRAYKINSNNQITLIDSNTDAGEYDNTFVTKVDENKVPTLAADATLVGLADNDAALWTSQSKKFFQVNEKCAIAFFAA